MKSIKASFLFATFTLLLFTNMKCKKDSLESRLETLPAETQTGARTFGCLVDGKVWLPKGNFPYSSLSTTIQYDILNLKTTRGNEGINIGIGNMISSGNYVFPMNKNHIEYYVAGVGYEAVQGTLTITRYDKINKILSGRFNFIGKDSTTSKTVSVTDGRFDVTFTN